MAKEPYRSPGSSSWIFGWHELHIPGFPWVPGYVKLESLKQARSSIISQIKPLRESPITKAEFEEDLRRAFESHEEARIISLARVLRGYVYPGKPSSFFGDPMFSENPHNRRAPASITWQDLEKAIQAMEFNPGALPRKEREKRISQLKAEKQRIEAEIEENRAPWLRTKKDGIGTIDIRESYVEYWRRIQNEIDGHCDPRGYELAGGPDGEIEAYHLLDIKSWQFYDSVYVPHPRPQMGN
ncbi:MAG: hypothetical protein R6V12_15805 [Candidatus Hydrogenedentota bacterium]